MGAAVERGDNGIFVCKRRTGLLMISAALVIVNFSWTLSSAAINQKDDRFAGEANIEEWLKSIIITVPSFSLGNKNDNENVTAGAASPPVIIPTEPVLTSNCQAVVKTEQFTQFCVDYSKTKRRTQCQTHVRELDDEVNNNNYTNSTIPTCKTLWIVAMSEGKRSSCQNTGTGEGDGYQLTYATALASMRQHADDTLQPVLLLARGSDSDDDTKKSKESSFSQWAQSQGVIVRQVDQLSFQDVVDRGLPNTTREQRVGFFLLFDIPQIVAEHNLTFSDKICDGHVFYTDADILFVNPFTWADLYTVKQRMLTSNKIMSYGRDYVINRRRPVNTGVIVMDLNGLAREWPKIRDFAARQAVFPDHDQTLLYHYYANRKFQMSQVDFMPLYWHWKAFWELQPSTMADIKIVHFHGPKPGSGMELMSNCEIDAVMLDDANSDNNKNRTKLFAAYHKMFQHAVCCDHGKTAATMLQLYRAWRPRDTAAICGE